MKKVINFLIKYKEFFVVLLLYGVMLIFFMRKVPTKLFLGISLILFIYILIFLWINKRKHIEISKIFLMLGIPLGIFMMLAIPLGNIPDERAHLARVYEISEFHFTSEIKEDNSTCGRILPEEIYNLNGYNYSYEETMNNLFSNSEKEMFVPFPNTSLYSVVSYIPQVIGIFIGKTLNLPIYITAYLGRISNFIIWTLLVYYAIKIVPYCKKIILFIALMPITLQEAVSLSPDAFTFSTALLLDLFGN